MNSPSHRAHRELASLQRLEWKHRYMSDIARFLDERGDTSVFLIEAIARNQGGTVFVRDAMGKVRGVSHYSDNGVFLVQFDEWSNDLLAPMLQKQYPPAALLGPTAQVEVVLEALSTSAPTMMFRNDEILYSLDLAHDRIPAEGRIAKAADEPVLRSMRAAFREEAFGMSKAEAHTAAREEVPALVAKGSVVLLEEAGKPVAIAMRIGLAARRLLIGGVFVPPALRSRGHCRRVTQALIDWTPSHDACRAVLYTAQHNLAAQRAYESLGFKKIGGFSVLRFGPLLHESARATVTA